MAEVNRRQRYTVYDYSAYDTTKVPREGEIRFFDTVKTYIINTLSVIGNGVSQVSALPFREIIYIEMSADIDISSLKVKGNVVRIQNTDSADHDVTTGSTPATYTAHPDLPRLYQFDGTNWIELASPVNYIPIEILDSTQTLPDYEGDHCFAVNGGATGIILTMPAAANNENIELRFKRTDSNASAVTLKFSQQVDGFTVSPDGYYYVFLFEQYHIIQFKSNGTQWCITGGWLDYGTGGINTSDWTDRHFGDEVVAYNNVTQAFVIGEKVTEATSNNTGVIVYINALGTSMILKKCTGTGHHVNARALTGGYGGGATVNGSTKNNDSVIYHNTGLPQSRLDFKLYVYENATFAWATARRVGTFAPDTTAGGPYYRNFTEWGIDTANVKIQTASTSVSVSDDSGVSLALTNQDYSFNESCIIKY